MASSNLERTFETWLRQHPDIPPAVPEYQFAPPRKWRLDFAWPDQKVAVEIEGVVYEDGGRHQRVKGFLADCEKYEAALVKGWKVYRVPGPWVAEGKTTIWRPQVMEVLRQLLKA